MHGPFFATLGCLFSLSGLDAEECQQAVLARRQTLYVPQGGVLSLWCEVQHCGEAGWTAEWLWKSSLEEDFSLLEPSVRHHLTNTSGSSAGRSRQLVTVLRVNWTDEGAYGCRVTWEQGHTDQGHLTYVNVTSGFLQAVSPQRNPLHRLLLCLGAALCCPLLLLLVGVVWARCLSSEVKPPRPLPRTLSIRCPLPHPSIGPPHTPPDLQPTPQTPRGPPHTPPYLQTTHHPYRDPPHPQPTPQPTIAPTHTAPQLKPTPHLPIGPPHTPPHPQPTPQPPIAPPHPPSHPEATPHPYRDPRHTPPHLEWWGHPSLPTTPQPLPRCPVPQKHHSSEGTRCPVPQKHHSSEAVPRPPTTTTTTTTQTEVVYADLSQKDITTHHQRPIRAPSQPIVYSELSFSS